MRSSMRLGEVAPAPQRLQLGLFDRDIEPDQHRACFDDLARSEANVTHRARQLVAHRDRTQRHDRADRRRRLAVFARLGDRGRYRFHRLRLIRCRGIGLFDRRLFPGRERDAG